MSSPASSHKVHRITGGGLVVLIAAAAALLSCRYGFETGEGSDPCLGVDCAGHGRCVRVGDEAVCACDPGYHWEDPLSCVPDETSDCVRDSDCDDGNPCTDDTCDPSSSCRNQPNTDPCDDGDPCTMDDACSQGSCSGAPLDTDGDGYAAAACSGTDCDDADAAVHPGAFEGPLGAASCADGVDNDCDGLTDAQDSGCLACGQDADCDDQNRCNGQERCVDGACRPGEDLDCDDGNPCTDDGCDPASGCTRQDNNDPCDDGDACSSLDVCVDGSCQAGQTDKDTDGDGYLDEACPGGDDCRDDLAAVHPGAAEGPAGDPNCSDGLDNDCDHATDGDDVGCMELVPLCDDRDWCFEHPLPQGDHLYGAAVAGDTIWVVGAYGAVLRLDEAGWSRIDLAMYDEAYESIGTVWARGEDDVWVAGGRDFIWHWDGTTWQDRSTGTGVFPYTLSGPAGTGMDIGASPWMAGNDNRRYTWDGAAWTFEDVPYSSYITCLWGLASDDLWLAGYEAGMALHWDGATWNNVTVPGAGDGCDGIWGTATDDLWGLFGWFDNLYHWDGAVWVKWDQPGTPGGTDIWGTSADDIWACDLYNYIDQGNMSHFDGNSWNGPFDTGVEVNLHAVVGRSPDDVWAFGNHGAMVHYNGTSWERASFHLTFEDLQDIWRAPGGEAWAVGDAGTILRRAGNSWTKVDSGVTRNLQAIWGVADDAVWAVGETGCILHWDGSTWNLQDAQVTNDLNAIWGVDADHLWIAGDGGLVLAGGQNGWTQESSDTTENLMGIHGTSLDDVWAVGAAGTIVHRDTGWSQVASNTTRLLRAVWATSPDEAWAVGGTTILSWDGTIWSGGSAKWVIPDYHDVCGTYAGDMWVVGTQGYIFHDSGTGWERLSEQANRSQHGLWVDATDIWIVGEGGIIVHKTKESW